MVAVVALVAHAKAVVLAQAMVAHAKAVVLAQAQAEGVAVDPRFRLEELEAALLGGRALEDPPEEEAEGAVEEACLAQVATLTSRADGAAALKEANDGARGKPTGRCVGLRPVCGITCRCICQEKRAELGSTTCG